jgi:hypothetical protein
VDGVLPDAPPAVPFEGAGVGAAPPVAPELGAELPPDPVPPVAPVEPDEPPLGPVAPDGALLVPVGAGLGLPELDPPPDGAGLPFVSAMIVSPSPSGSPPSRRRTMRTPSG